MKKRKFWSWRTKKHFKLKKFLYSINITWNIFYLVFCTSNNIIKKEKMTKFAVSIRQLHYKWVLHKTTLGSISRLSRRNKICVMNMDHILTILWHNLTFQISKSWYFGSWVSWVSHWIKFAAYTRVVLLKDNR